MEKDKNLEIQVSSTTLGYEGQGGTINSGLALAEGIVSKEAYTYLVKENAKAFKEETEKEIPEAKFGVSALASVINPKMMGDMVRSLDYPYAIDWGLDFVKEKKKKIEREGNEGKDAIIALGAELGYALLQARLGRGQVASTVKVAKKVNRETASDPVRIRTCIETVQFEDEIQKIRKITRKLLDKDISSIWVLEPNKKTGDRTLSEFLERYDRVIDSHPELRFAIDLDMGNLPEENNLLSVLDRMDRNRKLPLFISLSGQDSINGDVRTHLPLYESSIGYGSKLGEWMHTMQQRGNSLPGLVIETSPAQENVKQDYSNFLKEFNKGL